MNDINQLNSKAIKKTLDAYKCQSVDAVVINCISEMLSYNLSEGGTFDDLTAKLYLELLRAKSNYINVGVENLRALVMDAVSITNRNYHELFTNDLGLEWYSYSGTNLTTTRKFCIACSTKRYIHICEFPKIIKGDFDEFKSIGGKVNHKTGLADRLYKHTTPHNFTQLVGGRGCMHTMIAVDDLIVPASIKEKVFSSIDYKEWNNQ